MRRGLARVVAVLHYALIPYYLFGGLVPDPTWLLVHLWAVPLTVAHWPLNRGVCVLSNLESWLRSGRWWDAEDASQGGWVDGVTRAVLGGRTLPPAVVTALPYLLLTVAWGGSLAHYLALSE